MRSGNPLLRDNIFVQSGSAEKPMTLAGTINKTALLLAMSLITAVWMWQRFMQLQDPAPLMPWVMGGAVAGLVFALITCFAQRAAWITAPVYALCEGLVLGGLSAIYEIRYPGLVMQAVTLTFATLACMLVAYRTGLIRVTQRFRACLVAATGAIALVYLVNMVMSMFGHPLTFLNASSPLGIGISLVITGVAAFNLVLDFDFIATGVQRGAPRHMEWYAAFSVLATLIWLYIEMLRLLSKLRSR